jgi:mono/diheme cytochrome c family protein
MKSVNLHRQTFRLIFGCLALLVLFPLNLSAQEYDVANGEKHFKTTCAACHRIEGKLVGPELKGITEKRDMDWLLAWIKDSPGMIASGDELALQVFEENNRLPMVANPQLTDQDIIDILAYVEGKPDLSEPVAPVAQEPDPAVERGKALFKANCAACHKLEGMLIGPELLGITETRDPEWLKLWIRDNTALIASGDKLAKDVADSNPAVMTPFPQLSDEDIDDILKYLAVGDVDETAAVGTAADQDIFNKPGIGVGTTLFLTLLAFAVLALIVASTTNRHKRIDEDEESMVKAMLTSPFLRFLFFIFVLLGSTYMLFDWLLQIDVNEGYQPIQPIAFSHAVHAGDNKIDCQYCHFAAKNSKSSGIPSPNVCMNCHKTISEYNGELFNGYTKAQLDAEIQKIYDAVGWDKDNMQFIEGYEQKPIEWVRIHNLADFVYYNHSQHINVAGIDCQKCHGPVEEMHDMRQFSPLTMGWCIECHRDTDVDLTGNEYYAQYHDQLVRKYEKENVTVAELGGLECGKCHY